jgi:predicted Holliday junction resolvase-like endonuclease
VLLLSIVMAFLIFVIILAFTEAKQVKKRMLLQSQKQRESFQRDGIPRRKHSSTNLEDLNDLYDKINPAYLNEVNEDDIDNGQDYYMTRY